MAKSSKTLSEISGLAEGLWSKISEAKSNIKTSRIEYSRLINRGNDETAAKCLTVIRENISLCESCFTEIDGLREGLAMVADNQSRELSQKRSDLVREQDRLREIQLAVRAAELAVGAAVSGAGPLNTIRERLHVSRSDRDFDND
jgi:hypothetical protein